MITSHRNIPLGGHVTEAVHQRVVEETKKLGPRNLSVPRGHIELPARVSKSELMHLILEYVLSAK